MSLAHVHLILNHLPIAGTIFAAVLFAIAFIRKSGLLERVALGFLVAFAVLAIPVYLTGESAEEAVEHLPGVLEATIGRHEAAAMASLVAMEIVGAAALVALVLFWQTSVPRAIAAGLIGLTVITSGLFGWTGYLGGQIRHTEIAGVTTVQGEAGVAASARTTERDKDDD